MMDKSFIEKIESMAAVQKFQVHGVEYASKNLAIINRPKSENLTIHTLEAIVNFFTDCSTDMVDPIVHIYSPVEVNVVSGLHATYRDREKYVNAVCISDEFNFGEYISVEKFIIALQSQFVRCENIDNILRLVGNLSAEAKLSVEDDGVTQRTQARVGISKIENVAVPNPVRLTPRRTFPEIVQPESDFVLRLKGSVESGFSCALFEADGNAWKLEAIRHIRNWLRTQLPEGTKIIA